MDTNNWPVPGNDYKLVLKHGVGTRFVTTAARRHPVCFRDAVPAGFSMNVQLPADARLGKTFRMHIGPRPDSGTAWAIVGLAKRDGLSESRFRAKLNGQSLETAADLTNLKQLGGNSARAVRFACPLNVLKTGYNDLDLRQVAGSTGQQIVWVELRMDPGPETGPSNRQD